MSNFGMLFVIADSLAGLSFVQYLVDIIREQQLTEWRNGPPAGTPFDEGWWTDCTGGQGIKCLVRLFKQQDRIRYYTSEIVYGYGQLASAVPMDVVHI